jgi:steroid delta-isomerase-like uncharacterized protein
MSETAIHASEQPARDLMNRWYRAWNDHDPDAIAQMVTEDVVYEDPSAPPTVISGREAVRERARIYFLGVPDFHLEQHEAWVTPGGEVIATSFTATGTVTGPQPPPGLLPTGRRFHLGGMDRSEIRDGRLARHQIYADTADAARQVGWAPTRGGQAERIAVRLQNLAISVRERLNR